MEYFHLVCYVSKYGRQKIIPSQGVSFTTSNHHGTFTDSILD